MVVTISSVVALNVVWFHYVYSEGTDDNQNLTSAVYTVVLYTLFYAYIICVACQCVPHMKENLEELQPIGKGFVRIWKYFAHNAKMGAQLMLTSELVMCESAFVKFAQTMKETSCKKNGFRICRFSTCTFS